VAPLHSVRGGDGDGKQSQRLVTKPLAISMTELQLNIDTEAQGVAFVEILAGDNRGGNGSVPGFVFANIVPIIADSMQFVAQWHHAEYGITLLPHGSRAHAARWCSVVFLGVRRARVK
jgi:hypothetical protein